MRKNLLSIFFAISLVLCMFSLNTKGGSTVEYPAIMVVPESIWNTSMIPGKSFTVSIYTNYTGDDVWGYELTLHYNPNVLIAGLNQTDTWLGDGITYVFFGSKAPMRLYSEKVYVDGELQTRDVHYQMAYDYSWIIFFVPPPSGSVVKATYLYDGLNNGDLILGGTTMWYPGEFNDTSGELEYTTAYFDYTTKPPPMASGPGILANVSFTVVGYGFSDIIIGDETILTGWDPVKDFYDIVNAKNMPAHIRHGFFCNIPPRHDVAVVSLEAPDTVPVEQPVPINVTVANEGTYDESVTLTVKYDSTVIGSTPFTLEKGLSEKLSFSWDTSGVVPTSYTINATAAISVDDEPADNSKTKLVTLVWRHDVAVVSLEAPDTVAVNQPVPISVTVVNEGSYDESVTLTVKYDSTVIGSTTFTLAKGPTSKISSFSWNTSGLAEKSYKINATATVSVDDEPADNSKAKTINLQLVHDVAVVDITAPLRGNVNDTVLINVTVANEGSFTETFNVTAYYDSTYIVLPNGKNYTTVTLAIAQSKTITFTWNTTGLTFGYYTIKAWASNVTGETDKADNTLVDGKVLVTFLSDIRGPENPPGSGLYPPDGKVDGWDYGFIGLAFGKTSASPNWETYKIADTRGPAGPPDGVVDGWDYGYCGLQFGKSCN